MVRVVGLFQQQLPAVDGSILGGSLEKQIEVGLNPQRTRHDAINYSLKEIVKS